MGTFGSPGRGPYCSHKFGAGAVNTAYCKRDQGYLELFEILDKKSYISERNFT